MKKFIYSFLEKYIRKYIEKHYDFWGTKIITDLPPEFIITEHALERLKTRFNCSPEKRHKIMLKAWDSQEYPGNKFAKNAKYHHEKGIYKLFNGYIFVFRTRYNKRLGFCQKNLITIFKKNGYQYYTNIR